MTSENKIVKHKNVQFLSLFFLRQTLFSDLQRKRIPSNKKKKIIINDIVDDQVLK